MGLKTNFCRVFTTIVQWIGRGNLNKLVGMEGCAQIWKSLPIGMNKI